MVESLIFWRVVLVRHGQTEWNEARRFQGKTDISLSDVGRRQAQTVLRCPPPPIFSRIICTLNSPIDLALITVLPYSSFPATKLALTPVTVSNSSATWEFIICAFSFSPLQIEYAKPLSSTFAAATHAARISKVVGLTWKNRLTSAVSAPARFNHAAASKVRTPAFTENLLDLLIRYAYRIARRVEEDVAEGDGGRSRERFHRINE